MIEFPVAAEGDSDDVRWALETAGAMWAQGDSKEALRWLKKASESASEQGADMRSLALARFAADLRTSLAPVPSEIPPADAVPFSAPPGPLAPPGPAFPSGPVSPLAVSPLALSPSAGAPAAPSAPPAPMPPAPMIPPAPMAPAMAAQPPSAAPPAEAMAGTASSVPPATVRRSLPRPPPPRKPAVPDPDQFTPAPVSAPAIPPPPMSAQPISTPPISGPIPAASISQRTPHMPPSMPGLAPEQRDTLVKPKPSEHMVPPSQPPAYSAAPPPIDPGSANYILHQAVRVSIHPLEDQPGVFLTHILAGGVSAPRGGYEALLVALDPRVRLIKG